jgi:NAD(P)-dependent dehydrogenase (short-subunit alcohol dehydrogenase family)
MKLQDKVAIVTGGAQGIGEAIVRAYAAEGARVVIADVAEDKAQALARDLGNSALAVRLDVRDPASVSAMVKTRLTASVASTSWSTTPPSSTCSPC